MLQQNIATFRCRSSLSNSTKLACWIRNTFNNNIIYQLTWKALSSVLSTTSVSCALALMALSPAARKGRWEAAHSTSTSFRDRSTFMQEEEAGADSAEAAGTAPP